MTNTLRLIISKTIREERKLDQPANDKDQQQKP